MCKLPTPRTSANLEQANAPVREPNTPRRILLVDCDAFFVQVARLEDPEGAGRTPLLIVGGSPSGRGVVTSASYEARAHGVRSAMPTAQALRLCPDATVVGVPRESVSHRSGEVQAVLEDLAPVVQAASVDEFYLDFTGTERLFSHETLEETARRIREEVLAQTRISVSVGGGSGRVIAKLAATRAKPAGVHVVPAGAEQEFLDPLFLAELPGVGPALARSLKGKGLLTVADARAVQPEWLTRWFGPRRGTWLLQQIHGVDDSPVDPRARRKSISSERTFARNLQREEEIDRRLVELCTSVGRTLRKKGLRTRTITVKLRDPDFTTRQHTRTLSEPVETNPAILSAARDLLRDLLSDRGCPVRLLGVGLSGLTTPESGGQLTLFAEPGLQPETERDVDVSRAVDHLAERFGQDAVVPGTMVGRRRDTPRPVD